MIFTTVHTAPITATGNLSTLAGHQVKMTDHLYLHFTPAVAKQWISVLETIANEKSN